MVWNIDMDICALAFICILIFYYIRKRDLPLRRNRLFLILMFVSQLVALLDIIGSLVTVAYKEIPLWGVCLANIAYYVALTISPLVFTVYCMALCGCSFGEKRVLVYICNLIPVTVALAMVLLSPWLHLVFGLKENGEFYYGEWRPVIYVETCIYLLVGSYYMIRSRKKLRRSCRYAMAIYIISVFAGHTSQVFFQPLLPTVSLGVTLGILVMFLTFQHPDFYRDHTTSMFNLDGLDLQKQDDYVNGTHRCVAEIAFTNYAELKAVYGDVAMRQILEKVGLYLRLEFPHSYQFYVHGGRFLLLDKPNADLAAYKKLIQNRCEQPFVFEKGGVMLYPCFVYAKDINDFETHEELRESLHIAMGDALRRGVGSVAKVDDEVCRRAKRAMQVDVALERALQGEGLEVFYQPIYSTKERRVTTAEALVRIRDEKLGMLFPDEFIWKAEENGSILQLGQLVFEKVCKFIMDHDMEALGLDYIEVNLSPLQCVREQLAEELKSIVEKYGINPSYLNLEITETESTDSIVTQMNMEELLDYGMTFSLDDYGTGFSNLVNVLNMPLNIVKIDKSIVWAYFENHNQMLSHVLDIFKENNLKTVAEGIETEEMVDTLAEMGCDYLQGYFYSKPIAESEFLSYLDEQK